MKRLYAIGQRLMARILVISLFLQNCGGFRYAMSPGKKEVIGVTHTIDAQPLIGHEFMADRGNLVTFSQQNEQLQADVKVDAAQKEPNYRNLPVNIAADIEVGQLLALESKVQQRLIHFNRPKGDETGSVSIIKGGLLGGMIREEDEEDEEETIPNECFCPITQEIMEDPVIAQDGHSYERSAIAYWLNLGHRTSPKTGVRLLSTELTPNHTMRSLIQDLKSQMPVLARHKLEMSTIESAVKLREEEIQHVLELKRDLLQKAEQKVGQVFEVSRFTNVQNISIVGIRKTKTDWLGREVLGEDWEQFRYELSPDIVTTIKANSIKTVDYQCVCINPSSFYPEGHDMNLTDAIKDDVPVAMQNNIQQIINGVVHIPNEKDDGAIYESQR
eukprot:gene3028-3783_t